MSKKKFRQFIDYNDHEGETWTWWLQVNGNKEAIARLEELLDPNDEEFTLLDEVISEKELDLLTRFADGGYYLAHNAVTGRMRLLPSDTDAEDLAFTLYEGGVCDLFEEVDDVVA